MAARERTTEKNVGKRESTPRKFCDSTKYQGTALVVPKRSINRGILQSTENPWDLHEVSGHGFSRAEREVKKLRALAPGEAQVKRNVSRSH
jgi:hypothetical protein